MAAVAVDAEEPPLQGPLEAAAAAAEAAPFAAAAAAAALESPAAAAAAEEAVPAADAAEAAAAEAAPAENHGNVQTTSPAANSESPYVEHKYITRPTSGSACQVSSSAGTAMNNCSINVARRTAVASRGGGCSSALEEAGGARS